MWRLVVLIAASACSFQRGAAHGGDGGSGSADAATDGTPLDAFPPARMKADLAAHALANGSDLYFTLPNKTVLPYQIQSFTKATGHLEAWVKLDLSSTTTTTFQLRYGDATPTHAADPTGVFSASFLSVWHLDDTLATTAVADTLGAQNGTAAGSLGPAGHVTGKLGSAIQLDGVTNEITFTNAWTGGGAHTLSAWIDVVAPTSGFSSILTVGNAQTNQSRWFHTHYTALGCGFYGNDWTNSGESIDGAGWKLVHFVYDNATRSGTLYVDGALVATKGTAFATGIATQGTGGHIGNAPQAWGPGGNTPNPLHGSLDELRISTVARSAGWIQTEFANQSSPGTFYSIGPDVPAS